ncbi:dTDP-4-dehydrorhamnose 3,5-epimerase [Gammaproteobacteria bacterium]|nr:dTDP-4-dehydrorhamnose 3,5-epimerase [Gammaproteobacteria bacterium]
MPIAGRRPACQEGRGLKFLETEVDGAFIIEPERRSDERGYFARLWCAEELGGRGLEPRVAQINTGVSPRRGTLRGLHYQEAPHAEVKIARCVRGAAWDVVVDLRPESPTFRRWAAVELDAGNGRILYAPEGCAHGYLTLADDTELIYMASRPYAPQAARGVRYDDPAFGIAWPAPPAVISAADRSWPLFTP